MNKTHLSLHISCYRRQSSGLLIILAIAFMTLLACSTSSLRANTVDVTWVCQPTNMMDNYEINDELNWFRRSVWDLIAYQGRIYVGSGWIGAQRGDVYLWSFDGQGNVREEFAANNEQIPAHQFHVYNNKFIFTGVDANDPGNYNLFIWDGTNDWDKIHIASPHSVNKCGDVAMMTNGDIYVNPTEDLSMNSLYCVMKSSDGGSTWVDSLTNAYDVIGVYSNDLLLAGGEYFFRYTNGVLTQLAYLFPDMPSGAYSVGRPIPFKDGFLYTANRNIFQDTNSQLFFVNDLDGAGRSVKVPFFQDACVKDIGVQGDTCYVMTEQVIQQHTQYLGTVYSSSDLVTWNLLGSFLVPAQPWSFEILNGRFYVGMGQEWFDYSNTNSGTIYCLPPLVQAYSPRNGERHAATNTSLVVMFFENMSKGTNGNIVIKRAVDNSVFETIPVTNVNVTISTNVVTVVPTNMFDLEQRYYVQIDGTCFYNATTNYYGGIGETDSWWFATEVVWVNPEGMTNTIMRGHTPAVQNISVSNAGPDAVVCQVVVTNTAWVSSATNAWTLGAGATNQVSLVFSNTAAMTPGVYSQAVQIVSTNWGGFAKSVLVVEDVMDLQVSSGGLTNVAITGRAPPSQSFQVINPGVGIYSYSVTNTTNIWVSPSSATGTITGPGTNTISLIYSNTVGWAVGAISNTTILVVSTNGGGATQAVTVALSIAAYATNFYVSTNGLNIPPFTNWMTAATNLQDALNEAIDGDNIWVTNGTYVLTGQIDLDKAVNIQGINGYMNTVIRGKWLYRCFYISANATLSGLTINGGHLDTSSASAPVDCNGAGVYMAAGLVTNCLITGNGLSIPGTSGGRGAGVYMSGGTVSNCIIQGNSAIYCFGQGCGAGICVDGGTAVNLEVSQNASDYIGGGVYVADGLAIRDSTIVSNAADASLGGNYNSYGGGVYGNATNCMIAANSVQGYYGGHGYGAGVYGGAVNCMLAGNISLDGLGGGAYGSTLYNCLVIGNQAGSSGGGTYNCTLYNCTLTRNECGSGATGDGAYGGGVFNSIIYSNEFNAGNYDQVLFFTNCCTYPAQGGWASGNITNNPMFIDWGSGHGTNYIMGNYRLQSGSPCVNAGTNQTWMTSAVDLANEPRIIGQSVDMGAYEFLPASLTNSPACLTNKVMAGCTPNPQSFAVINLSSETLNYTLSTNANWVNLNSSAGTLSGYQTNQVTVNYGNTAGWMPGASNAMVMIISTNNGGTTQTVATLMNVMQLHASPTELTNSVMRGNTPSSQSFCVSNAGAGSFSYTVSTNASWVVAASNSGTLGAYASNNVAVSYASTAGWMPGVSNATITVASTDGGGATQTVAVTLTVTKQDQTIIFPAIADQAITNTVKLSATVSSGLSVSFTNIAGSLTWQNSTTITFSATGRVSIVANQPGNNNWNAAPNATNSFTVTQSGLKADQTIAFPTIADQFITNTIILSAMSLSGLPVNFAVGSGPAVLSDGSNLNFTATGRVSIVASQAGNTNWNPAPNVTNSFTVTGPGSSKQDQTITFTAIADQSVTNTLRLAATASSGLPVSFTNLAGSPVLWRNATTISFTSTGRVSIVASQPGNANWNAAPNMTNSFIVTGTSTSTPSVSSGVCADYDGDGKADPAVYDEATGKWKIRMSASGYALVVNTYNGLGGAGYASVSADYNGDGIADPAVYQEEAGTWIILLSSANYVKVTLSHFLGGPGYSAMPADYDGDNKADPCIYQRETGSWKLLLSSAGYYPVQLSKLFGGTGYLAVAADYDGDRKADPAIYGEANGIWAMMLSGAGYMTFTLTAPFGGTGWNPVPADYDGDGLADPAVKSASGTEWIVMLSSAGYTSVHVTLQF